MRKFISKIFILLLTLVSLQNCKYKGQIPVQSHLELTQSSSLKNEEKVIQYSIKIELIDSLKYNFIKQKSKQEKKSTLKITAINEVKKQLEGIVEFDESIAFDENPEVKNIHFRNGEKFENNDLCFFIAYFPEEDILLCEGGHSSDISFNLKNGNVTEKTGNPDLFLLSPTNKFRLNGSYDGHECYGYFIQAAKNEEFEKIIDLEKEVQRKTKISICAIKDGFWSNDNTLYLEKSYFDNEYSTYKYLKIEVIENEIK